MMVMMVVDVGKLLELSVYFVTRAITVVVLFDLHSDFPLSDLQHPAWSWKVLSVMIEAVYISRFAPPETFDHLFFLDSKRSLSVSLIRLHSETFFIGCDVMLYYIIYFIYIL